MSTRKTTAAFPPAGSAYPGGTGGGFGSIPVLGRPDLILDGKGGISIHTPASAVMSAGHTICAVAGQDTSISTQRQQAVAVQRGIALFTVGKAQDAQRTVQDTGIKLHAASGKVSAQARAGQVRLNADRAVTIASTSAGITIEAKTGILLTGGGTYLRLEGGNIELGTNGAADFKAGMKELAGAAHANVPGIEFAEAASKMKPMPVEFSLVDADGNSPAADTLAITPSQGSTEALNAVNGKAKAEDFKPGLMRGKQSNRRN